MNTISNNVFETVIEMMTNQMKDGLYDLYHDNYGDVYNTNKYEIGQELNVILKNNIKTTGVVKHFKFIRNKWYYQCYIRGISIIFDESKISPINKKED